MFSKQQQVKYGAAAAAVASAVFIYFGYRFYPFAGPELMSMADRLAFVFQCELFAMLMLLAGIGTIAKQRFQNKEAIDGATSNLPPAIELNLRYLQNTFEQFVLVVIAHLVLVTVIDSESVKIIPLLVCWWVIGRILFWLGYHQFPVGRAVGFGITFYPTVCVIAYSVYSVLFY